MVKIKKNKAFSFFEVILCLLIFSILINIAFLKYRDFSENQAITEAKIKINETFSLASITSLKEKKRQTLEMDFVKKQLILVDPLNKKIKTINLPKNLNYTQTYSDISKHQIISFTKNGNISRSFSIYIFNLKNKVRYKISFYGFNKTKFLKINNYRKRSNSEIFLSNINKYHNSTNEDRDSFYIDWRKE